MQYHHRPDYYPPAMRSWFASYNLEMARAARLVVAISRAVVTDVAAYLPEFVPKTRVLAVPSVPTSVWFAEDPNTVAAKYGVPSRYFVLPYQVCAHKNHRTILEAVRLLRDRGLRVDVVCTGRKEDYRDPDFFRHLADTVARAGLEDRVRFLGALPRGEHIALLRGAMAVLQPSEFEGWGFGISDAKALGKPVIASEIPVHHEHGHPDITYLPVVDAEAWAEALAGAARDRQAGPDHAAERSAAAVNAVNAQLAGVEAVNIFSEAFE